MDTEKLKNHLSEINRIPNQKWLENLSDRKVKELEFHNRDRDRNKIESIDTDTYNKIYSNKKFYSTVQKSTQFCKRWINNNSKDNFFGLCLW